MLAIEILVQAIVVIGLIAEQQRRGPDLARRMTPRNELRVRFRIANVDPHCFVPAIGDRSTGEDK